MLFFANACLPFLQVAELAECIGSALIQKGFKASPDQFIGIFAQNRPEVLTMSHLLISVVSCLQPMGTRLCVCFLLGIWLCGSSLESYRYENLN